MEDASGEKISYSRPSITGHFWLKRYWSVTNNPTDNPTTEVSNPLMFFTTKVGSYPITIIEDLDLPSLSIQVGAKFAGLVIPSWNDTAFAQDYAYWQLSKTSEKHINGSIKITLDATAFYNIDLSKRIFIAGITESPMNILSMTYNLSNFTVDIELENSIGYKRLVSLSKRG
jgi:hypothetical protein